MSAPADFAAAAQALAAALLEASVNPADAIRLLAELADFTPAAATTASAIGQSMATMQDASGDLFRRAAVVALARAAATYQPASYDDAVRIRDIVGGLLDDEITIAGDHGDDTSYSAMRVLRQAVVRDLTARGAQLVSMATFATPAPLPALVLANSLYQDAGRHDDLVTQANPRHPAFMPTRFRALAS